jgi:ABC-type lipoprotein release transport system permease subunit
MAIRSALGGTAAEIRKLVLGHGARIGIWGTAAGLAAFQLVAPLLKGQLYQTEPFDLVTTMAVTMTILGITIAASIAPSHRAGKTVLMDVLRDA